MKFHDPRQNCPPPSSHVIQLTGTIFEPTIVAEQQLTYIFFANLAEYDFTLLSTSLSILRRIPTIIDETNVLSKFHENWAKNVTSTVFTCFHYIHIEKNAPPTGSHVFSPISTIFKLVQEINKTNVLTNFHDYWAKIVTSRVFTRENCRYIHIEKNAPPTGGHVFSPISTIFELVRDIN
ncbi:hypothetical protein DPMN_132737 [Dreissena polymorpha]|uniref:Uncharacterized protein n=1 Tax=Dreissena polymorpha TaxID=45954 RepID=A0A9D4FYW0_DREPO|nr:hypothetical protein DPMN_132737 [Dreissena polymorpha]